MRSPSFVRSITTRLFILLFLTAGSVQAGLIHWQLNSQVSLNSGPDTLSIDGWDLQIDFLLDDEQTWGSLGGSSLVAPMVSAKGTLTNGASSATVGFNTASPAAWHAASGTSAGFVESLVSTGYVDLIINGTLTTVGGFQGNSLLTPSAGDSILVGHLPDALGTVQINGPGSVYSYLLVDATYSVATVSAPTTSILLISGLFTAGLTRRGKLGARNSSY